MSGPRRTKGETLPVATEQLAELKRQTENRVVKSNPNLAPTRNLIPARRGNPITAPPPPPPAHDGEVSEEVVIVMSDDEDDAPAQPSRRSRSDTLADPMTTSKLAETARGALTPPAATGANRNVKRRGG